MDKHQKSAVVEALNEKLEEAKAFYLTDFTGLNVRQITEFRSRLRKHGGEYLVVKNTLAQRALVGLELPDIAAYFAGPTGLVIGDAVGTAKVLTDFAREFGDRPTIKWGVVERRPFAADEVRRLADMPPKEVLLAQIAGGLQAPLTRLAGGMNQLLAGFARAVDQYRICREVAGAEVGMSGLPRHQDEDSPVIRTTRSDNSQGLARSAEHEKVGSRTLTLPASMETIQELEPEIREAVLGFARELDTWRFRASLAERERDPALPLCVGEAYTLAVDFGPVTEKVDRRTRQPSKISEHRIGIRAELVFLSSSVKFQAVTSAYTVVPKLLTDRTVWTARTELSLSDDDKATIPKIRIIPQTADEPRVEVLIFAGGELYRESSLKLRVVEAPNQ